ncbi:MAG TPA: SPOR domain-containing protein [Steroidobacteraceae bacterium]|nr:SPOR domain-containing protein [Steroidobacteraceae bacterium]
MRALALLLVIINLAYFGWATLVDEPSNAPTPSQLDASAPRLVLASERKSTPALDISKPTSPVDTTTVAANDSKCTSVGPFQDLSTATQASATVTSAGHVSRQRLEQGQLWVGYWVHVPGFTNREEAERAVARLKQHGIDDVYISLGSSADSQPSTNIVSLGVFKESERAQRLLQEAKDLGLPAQVSDRTRAGSVYWVDVDFDTAEPKFDFSVLGSRPGKILRLEQRPCATSSGDRSK